MFNVSQFLKSFSTVLISPWIPILWKPKKVPGSLYFATETIWVLSKPILNIKLEKRP